MQMVLTFDDEYVTKQTSDILEENHDYKSPDNHDLRLQYAVTTQ
jgi:hypothetical protein